MLSKFNSLLTLFLFLLPGVIFGKVNLPAIFQSHMVLQQNDDVLIWGTATPGSEVKIEPDWGKIVRTKANQQGSWSASLHTLKAGNKHVLIIADNDSEIKLNDILFGEVWLCSGQSNMNFPLAKADRWKSGVIDYQKVIAAANHPDIRYFDVERQTGSVPLDDCRGVWQPCSREAAGSFSAVAYYFALQLQNELKVPVGIIHTSWGGTSIEAWTRKEVFQADPAFSKIVELARQQKPVTGNPDSANLNSRNISYLFNGMLAPLISFKIKGMLWYQGENNAKSAALYQKIFPAFINDLRSQWKYDFPFYFVQLAPYKSSTPEIREAQFLTYRRVAGTGMAVITDVGDSTDVHPRNKEVVGKRLALWALAKTYKKKLDYSGPLYRSVEFKKNRAIISFDFSKGLYAASGELKGFTIAGSDKHFYPAKAEIKDDKVVVWSDNVAVPVAVRYGWKPANVAELYNAAKLPASSFRTDY